MALSFKQQVSLTFTGFLQQERTVVTYSWRREAKQYADDAVQEATSVTYASRVKR